MLTYVIQQSLAAEIALNRNELAAILSEVITLVELFDEMRPDLQAASGYVVVLSRHSPLMSYQTQLPWNLYSDVERHATDFEDWRYLFELNKQTEIVLLDLRLATLL